MTEAVIVSACRTPVGKFQGGLAPLSAPRLGAIVVREAVRRAGIEPSSVEECIMGCVLSAGLGQNPARQAAVYGGLPDSIGAMTINKVCGSGLKAVMLAAQAIRAGDAHCIVAGGMESMTNAPYLLDKARDGYRLGHGQLIDSMIRDGLWDVYNDFHMGSTAELVADKYKIARSEQDAFAVESHKRAIAAAQSGAFKEEIVPVEIPQKKGDPVVISADEGPRADTTLETLAKLRPAFTKEGGSVTAGNASTINDGAAAVVVMSAQKAQELGVKPLARIVGYASGGVEPKWVMMAPVEAVKNLQARTGQKISDFHAAELNEAFAVQSLACVREIGCDPAKVNVHGGAVAIGHPIGASGARVLTTLLYALKRRGEQRGLASLCIGGGNAVAMSVEMI
jgi:acetyl-CoA C-acetyltransferase